jgi:hypothetical protein
VASLWYPGLPFDDDTESHRVAACCNASDADRLTLHDFERIAL